MARTSALASPIQVWARISARTPRLEPEQIDEVRFDEARWRADSGPGLAEVLITLALRALEATPPGVSRMDAPSPASALVTLRELNEPDATLVAAANDILLAARDPQARLVVQRTIGAILDLWLQPVPRRWTSRQAAQAAYTFALGLGLLLASQGKRPAATARDRQLRPRIEALQARTPGRTLPEVQSPHWETPVFGVAEAQRGRLLLASFDTIATRGYEAVHVDAIARQAGVPLALAHTWYATDRLLLMDTMRRVQHQGFLANEDVQARLIAGFGPGITEAVMIREFMRPGRENQRACALELLRLCWADADQMRETEAELSGLAKGSRRSPTDAEAFIYVDWALGLGVIALAVIAPNAWRLPFDVVTVPLLDEPITASSTA